MAYEGHDMDTVTCPECLGDTVRGMVNGYGKCGACIKAHFLGVRD